jgi:hypothetical protein
VHQRQIIRQAVKTALLGATAAGTRVFESRVYAWKSSELPAISVYTLEDAVDPESRKSAPMELERDLSLAIEAVVKAGENVDDAMDAICEEIERAMHRDDSLGGACSWSVLRTTELDLVGNSDQVVGNARLTYQVHFVTGAPEAADTPLDDLKTANIRENLEPGQHPDNQAEDELEDLHL